MPGPTEPNGFLLYVGRTPGYAQLVKVFGKVLRLRRGRVTRDGHDLVVR